jgi:hypothetical protein
VEDILGEEDNKGQVEAAYPKAEEKAFNCDVCYTAFDQYNTFPLENCEHVYHKECMRNYLKT